MLHSKVYKSAVVSRRVNVAVLLVFVTQVLVPIGYMPAAIGSGQYVQLCPTGLGPDVMALLHPQHAAAMADQRFSTDDSHHHHMDHQRGTAPDQTAEHSVWSTQCPFGVFANSDIALQALGLNKPFILRASTHFRTKTASIAAQRVWSSLQARAPPLLIAA